MDRSGQTSSVSMRITINTGSKVGDDFKSSALLTHTLAHEVKHVDEVRGEGLLTRITANELCSTDDQPSPMTGVMPINKRHLTPTIIIVLVVALIALAVWILRPLPGHPV